MRAVKDAVLLFGDILAEIEFLKGALEHRNSQDLAADPVLFRAIQYSVLSFGEASKRMPDAIRFAHPNLPWKDMTRTRDFLAHDYDRVTPGIVWAAVRDDLIPLEVAILEACDVEIARRKT